MDFRLTCSWHARRMQLHFQLWARIAGANQWRAAAPMYRRLAHQGCILKSFNPAITGMLHPQLLAINALLDPPRRGAQPTAVAPVKSTYVQPLSGRPVYLFLKLRIFEALRVPKRAVYPFLLEPNFPCAKLQRSCLLCGFLGKQFSHLPHLPASICRRCGDQVLERTSVEVV